MILENREERLRQRDRQTERQSDGNFTKLERLWMISHSVVNKLT